MSPITLYENTLPKLSFTLNSWKKSNVCICMHTTRRKYHVPPPDIPLYPFPSKQEKQCFKLQTEEGFQLYNFFLFSFDPRILIYLS